MVEGGACEAQVTGVTAPKCLKGGGEFPADRHQPGPSIQGTAGKELLVEVVVRRSGVVAPPGVIPIGVRPIRPIRIPAPTETPSKAKSPTAASPAPSGIAPESATPAKPSAPGAVDSVERMKLTVGYARASASYTICSEACPTTGPGKRMPAWSGVASTRTAIESPRS